MFHRVQCSLMVVAGAAVVAVSTGFAEPPAPPAAPAPTTLTDDTLPQYLEMIRPRPDELRWREIPWRESFWQAILDGQREGKPVLLWAMNGHPMGCT